jgi:hypothetical protein
LTLAGSIPWALAKIGNSLRAESNTGPPIALHAKSFGFEMPYFFNVMMPAGVASCVM